MISYLIDAVLLVALAATSVQVGLMYREIRKLRRHDGEYREILGATSEALADVEAAVRDLNAHGAQVVMALGSRIEQAQAMIGELEERARVARGAFAHAEATAQRPFLAYSAAEAARESSNAQFVRRFEVDSPGSAYVAPAAMASQRRARLAPFEEPTLGDHLGNWRAAKPADFRRAPARIEKV